MLSVNFHSGFLYQRQLIHVTLVFELKVFAKVILQKKHYKVEIIQEDQQNSELINWSHEMHLRRLINFNLLYFQYDAHKQVPLWKLAKFQEV